MTISNLRGAAGSKDGRVAAKIVSAVGGAALLMSAVVSPALATDVKKGLRLAFFCSGNVNAYQQKGNVPPRMPPRSTARPFRHSMPCSTMPSSLIR